MNTTVKDVSLTRAMADRFASIGLNDAARKGIGSIPLAQQTVDDKLLLAHLALTDRKPKQALSYIDRLTTPDAETTRARALEMIGDHNSAAALFASANQIADAERASWMAEDWAALTSSETSPFNVAATALAAQQTYPVEAGMIESGQSLLTETAKLRAALSAVVQADN
jgi:hypothetical protein